jgi:hypothetical protein
LAARGGTGSFWKGEIAGVRVYSRKLTPEEIQQNAKQDFLRFGLFGEDGE